MTAPTLALPPAGGTGAGVEARRGILPLAATLAGAGAIAVMGGLVGAYLSLKRSPVPGPRRAQRSTGTPPPRSPSPC